jgi:hypothetical protein
MPFDRENLTEDTRTCIIKNCGANQRFPIHYHVKRTKELQQGIISIVVIDTKNMYQGKNNIIVQLFKAFCLFSLALNIK